MFADVDGPDGAEAAETRDCRDGRKYQWQEGELVVGDHRHKAAVAATMSREVVTIRRGGYMLIGGTNSATNLAMAKVAWDKKKPFMAVGGGTTRLTNEECSPYTTQP